MKHNPRKSIAALISGFLLVFSTILSQPIAAAASSQSQTSTPPLGNGILYYIKCKASNKYLDVAGGADKNGTSVQQYDFNGTASQKWYVVDDGNGYYNLQSACGSGSRVLDVAAGSSANNAKLDLYEANDTNAQKYKITFNQSDNSFSIYTGSTGGTKSLDVPGAGTSNGIQLQQYSANGTDAQKFYFEAVAASPGRSAVSSVQSGKKYYIKSLASQLYLTAKNNGDTNGTAVTQEYLSGLASQEWLLTDAGNGTYFISSASSATGRTIDVPGASKDNGARLQLYSSNGSNAQKYKIAYNSDGTFSIYTQASSLSKSFDIPGASSAAGTYVQQYAWNASSAQRFVFESAALNTAAAGSIASGSSYYIQSSFGDLFVSPNGSAAQDGTPLVQELRNGGATQQWVFTKNDDGSYTIISGESGKAVDVAGASNTNGAQIQLYTPNGSDAQKWYLNSNSDGTFSITSKCAGGSRGFDINGISPLPNAAVHLWAYNSQINQKWKLVPTASASVISVVNKSFNTTLSTLAKVNSVTASSINPTTLFADGTSKYEFLSLYGIGGITGENINAMLQNCGVLTGQGQAIVDAAAKYDINPVYLAAHMRSESDRGTSTLAKGRYIQAGTYQVKVFKNFDGSYTYKTITVSTSGTYYNLFGIGAYNTDPINGGFYYAASQNWNSILAAINGGASWISSHYIHNSQVGSSNYDQPTLYEMRWDPEGTARHGRQGTEYATDTNWAWNIASIIRQYDDIFTGKSIKFYVPQFNS